MTKREAAYLKKVSQEAYKEAKRMLDVIRYQYKWVGSGTEAEKLQGSIFNHGVEKTCIALDLPMPKIRDVYYRSDCWGQCLKAAKQILAKVKKGVA